MQLKDYYKTLEVSPAATALQVKKSFRRLALLHHPDKNPGNAVAEAKFKEIQEAYEVLSDPGQREEYNYKRWYSRTLKKQFSDEPLTPASIAGECIRLSNYLRTVNGFSVDFDGLSYHIRQLLSDKNIAILQQSADKSIRSKVIENILQAAEPLPSQYIEPIALLLLRVAGDDHSLAARIIVFSRQHKQNNDWQKYKMAVVVIITLLICWVIYMIS